MQRRQLLTTLAAFGCAFASALIPQASVSAQTKTIRMWTFLSATGTTPREVALAQIIKNYEAANPGTKIVVETQVWDQMTPKFLAAHRAGITRIILPKANEKDLKEVPEEVHKAVQFILAERIDDVLRAAIEETGEAAAKKTGPAAAAETVEVL